MSVLGVERIEAFMLLEPIFTSESKDKLKETSLLPVLADGSVVLKKGMKILGTCVDNGQVFLIVTQANTNQCLDPSLDISRQNN